VSFTDERDQSQIISSQGASGPQIFDRGAEKLTYRHSCGVVEGVRDKVRKISSSRHHVPKSWHEASPSFVSIKTVIAHKFSIRLSAS
jgi:hypothetical protein